MHCEVIDFSFMLWSITSLMTEKTLSVKLYPCESIHTTLKTSHNSSWYFDRWSPKKYIQTIFAKIKVLKLLLLIKSSHLQKLIHLWFWLVWNNCFDFMRSKNMIGKRFEKLRGFCMVVNHIEQIKARHTTNQFVNQWALFCKFDETIQNNCLAIAS